MSKREMLKEQFDFLPEESIEVVVEFVLFQRFKRENAVPLADAFPDMHEEIERKLDEADYFAKTSSVRYTHEEVFSRLRAKYG